MRTIKNKIFWAAFIFIWTISVPGLSAEDMPQSVSSEAGVQEAQPEADPKTASAQVQPPEDQNAEENKAPEDVVNIEPGNVTVNFKGADIKTVLAYISEVAGIDIVAAPEVKGIIDLRLNNKPWNVALDIIVRNYGFAYEREGGIIRVVTLDKLKQEEVVTHAVKVNYGKAKDIASSVEDIVGERGSVMYDDRTNMVLVTDIPTNTYKIGKIIERLDKETSQVLIEARVLETVLGDEEKLGIDWNVKVTASGAKRPITAPFNYYKDDATFLKSYYPLVQAGSDSTVTTTSGASGSNTTPPYPIASAGSKGFPYVDYTQDIFSDAFTFGTLDFTQFSAVLEMIKSRSDTNIVSNPRIATLNNNPANIIVGQTINLPKYERNTTTGKMEIAGYEAKDLGIKLKVTPHINEKEEIVVDLAPEISDFVRYDTLDASSGIVAPVFSSRQANTKIMVNNGDTIFIGGMIKENIIDSRKKLPLLGDIAGDLPYVGLLFTKKVKIKQKVELIFFITVRLVRPGEELKGVPNPEKTYKPAYEESVDKKKIFSKKRKIK